MQIKIKNSIYNGTVLEGLPFDLRWYENRPDFLYEPVNGKTIIKNHKSWYDISHWNSKEWLRKMFIHDICHCILYASRGDSHKIYLKDFGLDWSKVTRTGAWAVFHDISHLMDEYKIVALSEIIMNNSKPSPLTKDELIRKLSHEMEHLIDDDDYDSNDVEDVAHKRTRRMRLAYEYWIDSNGQSIINESVQKLKTLLKKKAR